MTNQLEIATSIAAPVAPMIQEINLDVLAQVGGGADGSNMY